MSKTYIGIDPGKKGGVAMVTDKGWLDCTVVTPLIDKDYDLAVMVDILLPHEGRDDIMAIVEHQWPRPKNGVKQAFMAGAGYFAWQMALTVLRIPYQVVRPQQSGGWQTEMFRGTSPKLATKARALIVAKRLWPKHDWLRTEKCTTPHDGMIDAALLAEYGRRMNL